MDILLFQVKDHGAAIVVIGHAVILAKDGPGPYVTHITTGKVVDKGIKDANNMGAAMAPAAYHGRYKG